MAGQVGAGLGVARGVPHATAAAVGAYGERIAERYLRDRGLTILDRNWRCHVGEIDIVARDGGCLVVCEVKTRRGSAFGTPVEAVDWRKLHRLRQLAAVWLAEQHEVRRQAAGGPPYPARAAGRDLHVDDVRVDVIGVLRPRRGACRIEHLVGVLL